VVAGRLQREADRLGCDSSTKSIVVVRSKWTADSRVVQALACNLSESGAINSPPALAVEKVGSSGSDDASDERIQVYY